MNYKQVFNANSSLQTDIELVKDSDCKQSPCEQILNYQRIPNRKTFIKGKVITNEHWGKTYIELETHWMQIDIVCMKIVGSGHRGQRDIKILFVFSFHFLFFQFVFFLSFLLFFSWRYCILHSFILFYFVFLSFLFSTALLYFAFLFSSISFLFLFLI